MRSVSIFSSYKQENQFTNGLVSLLELSKKGKPGFPALFLKELLPGGPQGKIDTFHVLKEIDGAADAELCGDRFCIRIETKIWSSTLTDRQVRLRLKELRAAKTKLKRLVLLTPDDSNSAYIKNIRELDQTRILHLEWRRVYEFLKTHKNDMGAVFAELTDQFLELIHDTVFEQDVVAAILVVDFGKKSGIYPDVYLDEIQDGADGWSYWNTPKKYRGLDGTGRKLMLYDKTRKAITAVGEIKRVKKTDWEPDYPYTNWFVPGSLHVLPEPIPLKRIHRLEGFKFLGKCQNACWNVTLEEYHALTENAR
jgi:hypothetical protein